MKQMYLYTYIEKNGKIFLDWSPWEIKAVICFDSSTGSAPVTKKMKPLLKLKPDWFQKSFK